MFSTHEPNFIKKNQSNDETQDTNTLKFVLVPISNAKNVEEIKFKIYSPMIKYIQNTSNSCCFSSLASASVIKYAHNTYGGRTQRDTVGRYIV